MFHWKNAKLSQDDPGESDSIPLQKLPQPPLYDIEKLFLSKNQPSEKHPHEIRALCFISKDLLVSGGPSHYNGHFGSIIKIWDIKQGKCLKTIPSPHKDYWLENLYYLKENQFASWVENEIKSLSTGQTLYWI